MESDHETKAPGAQKAMTCGETDEHFIKLVVDKNAEGLEHASGHVCRPAKGVLPVAAGKGYGRC